MPPGKKKTTKEERLLSQIASNERLLTETEKFFLSDWFSDLTEVNGEWLLERLKKTEV